MADIKYVITVDSAGAQSAMKTWDQALKEAQGTAAKAESAHAGLWKQFALGQVAVDVLRKGMTLLWGELKSTVGAAIEAEQSEVKLATALTTTGRTIEGMLEPLMKFGQEQAKVTNFTDDQVMASEALLVQLTTLNREGIENAVRGAMGLSKVMGTDLQTATLTVTKAMEGNYTALGRIGIKINENLPPHEKQAELMRRLIELYPQATAQMDTFGGKVTSLTNWWGELKESVGMAVVENERIKTALDDIKNAIIALIESGKLEAWIKSISKAFEELYQYVKTTKEEIEAITGVAVKAYNVINTLVNPLAAVLKNEQDLYAGMRGGKDVVLNDFVGPIKTAGTAVNETGNRVSDLGKKIEKIKTTIANTGIPAARDLTNALLMLKNAMDGEVAPAARRMNEVLEQAVSGEVVDRTNAFWNNIKTKSKETTNYVSLLMDDIRRGFASTIKEWISGATTFKDFMKGLFGNVRDAFFGMISEMIAEWTLNFLKNIVTGATSAFSEVAKGASNLVAGVGNALTGGLASGIGAFVGTFLGTLLGGGGGNNKDITYWLKMIKDNSQILVNMVTDNFNGMLHALVDGKDRMIEQNDWHGGLLDAIERNTRTTADILSKVTFAQHGVDMTVTHPTLFMAGERGAERVTVAPNVNINPKFSMEPTTLQVNIDGHPLMNILVKYLPEYTRAAVVKIHSNAIVSY